MLHGIKHKFDLYFDSALNVTNQVINNPKTAPISASALVGISMADVDVALGIIGGLFGLIVGAASLWVMLEKYRYDRGRRKMQAEIDRLKLQNLKSKNKSLENHIKNQSRK